VNGALLYGNAYDTYVIPPVIIAHRTCPLDAPENSLEGVCVAAGQGADGVEIDLRLSVDVQPFLMHDWTMRRTTGFPLPVELTPSAFVKRQQLRRSEERVPTLGAALDALPDGLLLAVDVKTPWAIFRLVKDIQRRRLEPRVLIWCTSALAVRYAVRAAPAVEVAYLKDVTEPVGKRHFIAKAQHLGARAVSAHWRAVDADFVAAAHNLGLRVYSYHGGAELEPQKLASGLDGLITDFPRVAREALALV
jgi:glycerophosphoryl diester phosphodiesterase